MKLKDCEVGMECLFNNKKWKIDSMCDDGRINLKRSGEFGKEIANVISDYIEPVNKFEVGDEVYYKKIEDIMNLRGYKTNGEAIVESHKTGHLYSTNLDNLSPLKKKDELEKGDKFINIDNDTIKVLKKYKDDYDIKYVGYTFIGDLKYIGLWTTGEIQEIIYD